MGEVLDYFNSMIQNKITESSTLEYKSQYIGSECEKCNKKDYVWLKSLCAFLNTNDGRILLGLEADKAKLPTNVKWLKITEEELRRRISERIFPKPENNVISISQEANENHNCIFVIDVKKSRKRPFSYNGIFYRRKDDEDLSMNIEEIKRILFEEQVLNLLFREMEENFELAEKIYTGAQQVSVRGLSHELDRMPTVYFSPLKTEAWDIIISKGLIGVLEDNLLELEKTYSRIKRINNLNEVQARSGPGKGPNKFIVDETDNARPPYGNPIHSHIEAEIHLLKADMVKFSKKLREAGYEIKELKC